jgi:hypothetical protein
MKEVRVSRSCWVLAVWAALAAVSTGCGSSGPKLYPASGTVTFEDKPVEGATVLFIPQQGAPSMGVTDASGKYTISTRGQPGAAAAGYNVTVVKQSAEETSAPDAVAPQVAGGEPTDEEKKKFMQRSQEAQQQMVGEMMASSKTLPKDLLPYKYSIPEGSGLHATVTTDASKNVFDFPLTP